MKKEIAQAKTILEQNRVIAFPTDTVYGLGANACSTEAVEKVFKLKRRSFSKTVMINALPDWIMQYCDVTLDIEKLIQAFWPGALALVLSVKPGHPFTSAVIQNGTIAVRYPDHPFVKELLDALPFPITSTSANLTGEPSVTRAQDVNLPVDLVIDGGKCNLGKGSTLLDVSCEPFKILREGPITRKQIEEVIGCL